MPDAYIDTYAIGYKEPSGRLKRNLTSPQSFAYQGESESSQMSRRSGESADDPVSPSLALAQEDHHPSIGLVLHSHLLFCPSHA